MYIYLDIEKAKEGIALVLSVTDIRIKNYKEYFEEKAVEYISENIPPFISYDTETDTIRKATKEEMFKRKQLKLENNQFINMNGEIITYDIFTQKVVDNILVEKTRKDYIDNNIITIESEKNKARSKRKAVFYTLDKYDKAVLRNDIDESNEHKLLRDTFRKEWLDLPNSYIDISIPIESLFPVMPNFIKYFE